MARKRKPPVEDIRSPIEKRDDALAKMALYRDSFHHGWLANFSAKSFIRAIIVGSVVIVLLFYLWSLASGLMGW